MPKLIIIILLVSCIHLKDDNVKEFENETNDKKHYNKSVTII